MKDVLLDTLIDGVKLLPFLFLAFLLIEFVEHRLSNKSKSIIAKSGKFGPVIGSFLGAIPQCGFSVMATNLYVTRIITMGTLISIYLSTSDEMLPVLLSQNASASLIISILAIKVLIGMISGFIIDFILRKKQSNISYEICDSEHCHCEKGVVASALIHTFKTVVFIMLVSFILNMTVEVLGEAFISQIFLKNTIFGPFIMSLIGLIPNCGSSVAITQLYLSNAVSFGSMIAGLLTGSGVALLILFKSNKKIKENLTIVGIIYGIGVLCGIAIELIQKLL